MHIVSLITFSTLFLQCSSFQFATISRPLRTSTSSITKIFSYPSEEEDGSNPIPKKIIDRIEDAKADLVQLCKSSTKPSLESVQSKVQLLEELAEMGGIGQASSHSGLLSGEWYVSYIH